MTPPARLHDPQLRGILMGASVLRVVTLGWTVAVVSIDANSGVLDSTVPAIGGMALMVAWTAATAWWARFDVPRIASTPVVVADLAIAAVIASLDVVAYSGSHPQSFGSAWPLAAVVSTAAVLGPRWGGVAGTALGAVNLLAAAAAGQTDGRLLALCGTIVLFAAAGVVAGYVSQRLREAETVIADAKARDNVARTLHDGMLQTLAVVQRRSEDRNLVDMARQQELELRSYIAGETPNRTDLVREIRDTATRFERDHQMRCEIVVIDRPQGLDETVVSALADAVSEAMTNAGKHSGSDSITVCLDRDDSGTICTVKDHGSGFDTTSASTGLGLKVSIRERIAGVGGDVEVTSQRGVGTEVRLWVP